MTRTYRVGQRWWWGRLHQQRMVIAVVFGV
jgi:hypothetical protein